MVFLSLLITSTSYAGEIAEYLKNFDINLVANENYTLTGKVHTGKLVGTETECALVFEESEDSEILYITRKDGIRADIIIREDNLSFYKDQPQNVSTTEGGEHVVTSVIEFVTSAQKGNSLVVIGRYSLVNPQTNEAVYFQSLSCQLD